MSAMSRPAFCLNMEKCRSKSIERVLSDCGHWPKMESTGGRAGWLCLTEFSGSQMV